MVLDLMKQLDREFTERNKIEILLRELLDARRNRKSSRRGKWKQRRRKHPAVPTMTMPPLLAPAMLLRRKGPEADSLWRGISIASASCMTWRRKRSPALPASTICGPLGKSRVSGTNTFRRN